MKKKLISIMLVSAMAAAMAGCGSSVPKVAKFLVG